ncbi:MAG: hypothetical protein H6702_20585 [Myxococcales bacterium]|nr:hypothetical protein [Myxococcales bacterium]
MKTKAYKLAAELGLREQQVLEWLRSHGYPNVRRADTIRADVAQAARRALSGARRGGGAPTASVAPSGATAGGGGRMRGPSRAPSRVPAPAPAEESPGFRTTFADLLEQHLPSQEAATSAIPDTARTVEMAVPPLALRQAIAQGEAADALRRRVAEAERRRDEAQQAQEAAELAQRAAQAALNAARGELGRLEGEPERRARAESELERVQLERSTLRQRLQATEDERSTLEQTCGELQAEVRELREAVERYETDERDRQAVEGDLEQAKQREMAWRTRALELERAHQHGANLPVLLQGFGLTEPRHQADVLRALLDHRETATAVLRAIQHVDAGQVQRLVTQKVVETCAHVICNQVVALDQKVAVRVESERRCRVCQGHADRRWFTRMARECTRAGVRRLLVIGGGVEVQDRLRALSEGQSVDLRLVADDDPVQPARVKGRVEGCDLLVLWTAQGDAPLPMAYAEAARGEGRGVLRVLGATPRVVELARAVTHRLARDHVLRAE